MPKIFQAIKHNQLWTLISQRLQLKMMVVVMLGLLIPIAVIGAYSFNVVSEEVLRTAEEKNLQFVKSQSAAALRFLTEGERDALFLSQSPATRRFVGTLVGVEDTSTELLLASQLKLFLKNEPVYLSVRILDISGREVFGMDNHNGEVRTLPKSELESQASQIYFIETLRLAGQVYISDVELDKTDKQNPAAAVPIVYFSLPLYAESGGIAGVIAIRAIAEPILQAASANTADDTLYIVDDSGEYLSYPDPAKLYGTILQTGITLAKERPDDNVVIRSAPEGTVFSAKDHPDLLQSFITVALPERDDSHWTFVFEEKQSKVLSEINSALLVIIGLASLALLVALAVAWLMTRNIVLPVQQLARAAVSISRGEWDVAIPTVSSGDEITKLAVAFERMSKELRALYDNLEMRVIARTSELETVAKVSAAAAAVLDLDKLLQTASELTRASFDLSKVQVYLLDSSRKQLVLADSLYATEALTNSQRNSSEANVIPLDSPDAIIAQAGRTGQGITINYTAPRQGSDEPATHSVLAVPLTIANELLGVLAMHSEQADRFTEPELRVMTILADQIAVAVKNAILYRDQLATTQQLGVARQRAEEANKAKSLFLSNMSHELRTPLNVVIGYTSSILERPSMYDNVALPAVYANDIKLIRENGYHLIGLINDILDLSKIEAGRLELVREAMSLTDIFRGVLATSIGLVKDKPVLIKSDLPDQLPIVYADPTRVRQVILNLMSNAVKFTERGSVTLRAHVEGSFVRIEVIDTGIGIPEKALPHIFDRFQQATHDINRLYGGTGLGLDISKQLCQMHGGDLLVESVYGKGSSFSFELPVLEVEPDSAVAGPEAPLTGAPTTSRVFAPAQAQEPMASVCLLVEDELSTMDFMRRTLESAGYIVLSARDGTEAVEMAAGWMPDVIIVDIQISSGSGWKIVNILRQDADSADIPIIVCTTDPDQAFTPGVAGIVRKPFTTPQILDVVARATKFLPIQSDSTPRDNQPTVAGA